MTSLSLKALLASATIGVMASTASAQDSLDINSAYSDLESASQLTPAQLETLIDEFSTVEEDSTFGQSMAATYQLNEILKQNEEDLPALWQALNELYDHGSDLERSVALRNLVKAADDAERIEIVWQQTLRGMQETENPYVSSMARALLPLVAIKSEVHVADAFELFSDILTNRSWNNDADAYSITNGIAILAIHDPAYKERAWDALTQQENIDISYNSIGYMGANYEDYRQESWGLLFDNIDSDVPNAYAIGGARLIAKSSSQYARDVVGNERIHELLSDDDFSLASQAMYLLLESASISEWMAKTYLLDAMFLVEENFFANLDDEANASIKIGMKSQVWEWFEALDELWDIRDSDPARVPEL